MNMKKLGLFAISLMSVSFLASCVNRSSTHTIHIEHDEHCTVSANNVTGTTGSIQTFTINTFNGYDLANDGLNFVNEQGAAITYDGDANYNYETKEISVEIGSSDTTLKCTTDVAYEISLVSNHCGTNKESLIGPAGSTRDFIIIPDDNYVFSESGLGFVDEQDELIVDYDGDFSYDNHVIVSVTIGSSNAKLACVASKVYEVGISFTNCTSSDISLFEGPKGHSKTFNILANEGYVLNNDSFTWVNSKQEEIDNYDGGFSYDPSNNKVEVSIGDGDATLKCTAFKTHTITIDTINCTANKPAIIGINDSEATFTLTPDRENGYTLDNSCFSWVDDGGQVIAGYDGSYSYDESNNTMTLTVGNGDATLKCEAILRTSVVTIKASGNCSAESLEVSGKIGETKTFKLNVTGGNTVSFTFAPDTTGATASFNSSNGIVTVTIGNNDVVLDCSTTPITYTWSLSIPLDSSCVPSVSTISGTIGTKVEFSYTLLEGYEFANPALSFSDNNTGATYEFRGTNAIVITFGAGGGSITFNTVERWYNYHDWWNYCSNGETGVQANENDIGKIVTATLTNNVTHKVRLIDIGHDYLASDNTKYAHCSFEFLDVITNSDGTAYSGSWDAYGDDDYLESTLIRVLEKGGPIYNLIDSSLMNKIVNVTKYVAHEVWTWTGGWNYENDPFNTKLFPLSYHEIVNADHIPDVMDYEGYIYTYYKNNTDVLDRKKYTAAVDYSFSYASYWLRSPYRDLNHVNKVWSVCKDGTISEFKSTSSSGIALGFCV